jgi:hypothetical protein
MEVPAEWNRRRSARNKLYIKAIVLHAVIIAYCEEEEDQ